MVTVASPFVDRMLTRYVAELLENAHVPEGLDEAAQAEAWASGAVAEWVDLGGDWTGLAGHVSSAPLAAALIDWIAGGPVPTAGPDWIGDVGRHEPVSAVELTDDAGVAEIALIVGFEAPSGAVHDMSITLLDDAVVDFAIGPAGLADAASDDETSSLLVSERPIDGVIDQIAAGFRSIERERLEVNALLNLPLFLHRFDVSPQELPQDEDSASGEQVPVASERDPEDDAYAAGLLRSTLRLHDFAVADDWDSFDAPDEVHAAFGQLRDLVAAEDPDALTVLDVAGVSSLASPADALRSVAAYLAPVDLSAHTGPTRAALLELEWADWLGAVLGLSRSAPGTDVDGDVLVTLINRCPEITTTIPRADAPRIAWAFEQTLFAWAVTGVLDAQGHLTAAGRWLLPRAAIAAWC